MSDYKTINIDDIADQGALVPDGIYTFRLKEAKGSDKKNMTIAEFEVVSGEYEGFTSTMFFLLENDKGPFNLGILSVKKSLAAIERPLGAGYPFPLDGSAVAKLIEKSFGKLKVTGEVKTTTNKKTGKSFTGLTITGLATTQHTDYNTKMVEDYNTETVEDFDDEYIESDTSVDDFFVDTYESASA